MDIKTSSVTLRPRTPYESLDLGVKLARVHWRPLTLLWLLGSLPFALTSLFLVWNGYYGSTLLLWYVKPLIETLVLHYLAQVIFNPDLNVIDIAKKAPSLMSNDLLAKLTYRRLSFTRSFDMPVGELERLKGKPRSQRLHTLHRQSSGAAIWLTIIGTHIEILLILAAITLIYMFWPEYYELETDLLEQLIRTDNLARPLELLSFGIAYCAYLLIAPFYVASGFCLYLNRRTKLEAWDIEIQLKNLQSAHSSKATEASAESSPKTLLVMVFVTMFMGMSLSPTADAAPSNQLQQSLGAKTNAYDSRERIIEIKESEDFNQLEDTKELRPIDPNFWDEEDDTDYNDDFDDLDIELIEAIAKYLEFILWTLFVVAILYVLWRYRHFRFGKTIASDTAPIERPETLFGLDVRKTSLPDDIVNTAKKYWNQHDKRGAYSLLYRAALVNIIETEQLPLKESYTEDECVDAFRAVDADTKSLFFAQLSQQWQKAAYGVSPPSKTVFDTTCDAWDFHFSNSGTGNHGDNEVNT